MSKLSELIHKVEQSTTRAQFDELKNEADEELSEQDRQAFAESWLMMGYAKGVFVLFLVLMIGCGPINVPPDFVDLVTCLASCSGECAKVEGGYVCKPGQDPCAACPPGWECVDHECVEPEPPPTCEPPLVWNDTIEACAVDAYTPDGRRRCKPVDSIVTACWNKPPDQDWKWIPEAPPPPQAQYCPLSEEVLEAIPGGQPEAHDEIFKATSRLGNLPGLTPKQKLQRLADTLTEQTGWCWTAGKEAIFVIREDWTYGEYHAVSFDDGGWTNSGRGKWIGRHRDKRITDVGLHHPDPRGLTFKFRIKVNARDIDTTLTTVNELEYCRAIRMGKFGTLPRAGCPVRPEGQAEREYWERVIVGDQIHECNGERMPYKDGNFAVAKGTCHGLYRTCSEDRSICTEEEM